MHEIQKLKQACIIPLDIWREEVFGFLLNIGPKLNLGLYDGLADWVFSKGKEFFYEGQQHKYLEFSQTHPFAPVTIGYVEMQLRAGFNALYQNLLKEFVKNAAQYTSGHNVMLFNSSPCMNDSRIDSDDDVIVHPSQADFNEFVADCIKYHKTIIAFNAAYLCQLHVHLQQNPDIELNDEFIDRFKLNCISKVEEDLAVQLDSLGSSHKALVAPNRQELR